MDDDNSSDSLIADAPPSRQFGSTDENPRSSSHDSANGSSQKLVDKEEMRTRADQYVEWVRPLIAEFFGQLIFAFLHSSAVNTINVGPETPANALLPAISDGLTVTILVIIIGHISGAHVNFSVTTAVFIGGGIKWMMVPLYLVAQLLGSLAGAGLAFVTNGEASGAFALGTDVTIGRGLLMEVVLSSLLSLAVLMAAVELGTVNAAFAIGFSILIDIIAGFNISGGCMNPTLSFGPAVVSGQWDNYWIYWVGPLLGALFSGTIFRLFLGGKARLLFREPPATPTSNNDVVMEKGQMTEVTAH